MRFKVGEITGCLISLSGALDTSSSPWILISSSIKREQPQLHEPQL